MAETDLFNLGDTSGENSSFQELANQAAPSGGNPILSEEEGTPLPPPQKVSQPVLDALSRPQDPTQLLHEDIHVNSILDVKETLNERLNRMSSPHFEADFGDKDLSREDFFPTIDRKILAGQSTNDFVGTQPIFVGEGALFPFAIQQSRQKALSKAAEKRAAVRKKVRKLTEMHAVAQYDEEFQGMVSGLLEEFGEKSGWRLEDLADSRNEMGREFFKRLNKLKVLRNDLTAADTKAREVRKTFTDPKTFTPESVLESTRKIIAGQGDLEGMLKDKKKRAEFYEGVASLTSYENATKFLDSRFEGTKIGKEISSELERSLDEIMSGTNKQLQDSIISKWAGEESDEVIEVIKEIIPKGKVEDLVRTAIKHSNVYKGEDLLSDKEGTAEEKREAIIQEYIDYTYNKLGQKLKLDVTYPKKRTKKDDDGGGDDDKIKGTIFSDLSKVFEVNKDNQIYKIEKVKKANALRNSSVRKLQLISSDPKATAEEVAQAKKNVVNASMEQANLYATALSKRYAASFVANRKDNTIRGKIAFMPRKDEERRLNVRHSKYNYNGQWMNPQAFIDKARKDTKGWTNLEGLTDKQAKVLLTVKGLKGKGVADFKLLVEKYDKEKITEEGNAVDLGSGAATVSREEMFFKYQDAQGNWKEVRPSNITPANEDKMIPFMRVVFNPRALLIGSKGGEGIQPSAKYTDANIEPIAMEFNMTQGADVAMMDALSKNANNEYDKRKDPRFKSLGSKPIGKVDTKSPTTIVFE